MWNEGLRKEGGLNQGMSGRGNKKIKNIKEREKKKKKNIFLMDHYLW